MELTRLAFRLNAGSGTMRMGSDRGGARLRGLTTYYLRAISSRLARGALIIAKVGWVCKGIQA